MICSRWDVVVVPFPFVDGPGDKRRPGLVVSNKAFNTHGHTVLAMITTKGHSPWPGDHVLVERKAARLSAECLVRLKLFTLDNRVLLKRIGRLASVDHQRVADELRSHLLD
jgi:mRNA interferase MazF